MNYYPQEWNENSRLSGTKREKREDGQREELAPEGRLWSGAPRAPKSQALNRILKESPEDLKKVTNYRGIIDFRNVVAHAYDHLEDALVWGLASNQLHKLIAELEAIDGVDP